MEVVWKFSKRTSTGFVSYMKKDNGSFLQTANLIKSQRVRNSSKDSPENKSPNISRRKTPLSDSTTCLRNQTKLNRPSNKTKNSSATHSLKTQTDEWVSINQFRARFPKPLPNRRPARLQVRPAWLRLHQYLPHRFHLPMGRARPSVWSQLLLKTNS